MSELKNTNPVIADCELKPKNNKERTLQDNEIPGYSIHPVNLESNRGRWLAIYTHSSLHQSVGQHYLAHQIEIMKI